MLGVHGSGSFHRRFSDFGVAREKMTAQDAPGATIDRRPDPYYPPAGASPTGLIDHGRPARFAIVAHRLHLGANDGVPFIDLAQEYVTEVQRPDSVVDFFQADLVLLEGVGEKE